MLCVKSQSQEETDPGFNPRELGSRVFLLEPMCPDFLYAVRIKISTSGG